MLNNQVADIFSGDRTVKITDNFYVNPILCVPTCI